MTASDYPVTFPYGATTFPYSKDRPHRGNDRKMPTGTPILIGNTVIALSGNSGSFNGQVYEPHLHSQAGTDQACQNTVHPALYEFKPGVVATVGTGVQWGKFVTIKTLSGMYIAYVHLSQVNVKVGQVIGGTMPPVTATDRQIDETINAGHFAAFGVKPEQVVYDTYRPLLKNNYVEGNLTMLKQFYEDPNSLANKPSDFVPVGQLYMEAPKKG